MFNLERATNSKALKTLIKSYNQDWQGNYTMTNLINLWYYKCTDDKNKVVVRAYYTYISKTGITGYWNAFFIYNIKKNTYTYQIGSGNYADCSYNGLTREQLKKLTIYYYNPNISANNFVLEKVSQSLVC